MSDKKVEVELVKGTVFQFDPAKKYVIIFDNRDISVEDAVTATEKLGVGGVTILTRGGGIPQIMEA